MQTKTYFTTSTFYTTYIDKDRTITKTRTNVRSSVLTETYTGGQFDYLPGPDQTLSPTIEESPKVKYLSLGPNIYGKVKTLYTTFTYFNSILTLLTKDNKSKSDFHTLFLCTFDYHDKRKLGSGPDQLIVIHKNK